MRGDGGPQGRGRGGVLQAGHRHGQHREAARLERSNTGGLNEMVWGPATRRAPEAGEVEIAVEATDTITVFNI